MNILYGPLFTSMAFHSGIFVNPPHMMALYNLPIPPRHAPLVISE